MEFDTSVIARMPERSRRTFDSLIRAWNLAHSAQKDFKTVGSLKRTDRRKLTFKGDGLRTMKSNPRTKKSLALFTRAYNIKCTELIGEKPKSKSKVTRTRKKDESAAAS